MGIGFRCEMWNLDSMSWYTVSCLLKWDGFTVCTPHPHWHWFRKQQTSTNAVYTYQYTVHIFIKYNSIFSLNCTAFFIIIWSHGYEAFKQATLKLFGQKDAVHKLWIPVMESESSLPYLQYSELHVRKIVPYGNGLQLQQASINSTGTRETSKTYNGDVFKKVEEL